MIAPLQTMPGWPEVPEVTLVDNLVWLLWWPLAVFVVIAVIYLAAARGKEDPSLHPPTEPVTLGGAGRQAPAVTSGPTAEQSTGGSHARW